MLHLLTITHHQASQSQNHVAGWNLALLSFRQLLLEGDDPGRWHVRSVLQPCDQPAAFKERPFPASRIGRLLRLSL
jgi:hypothetical protein